MERGQATGGRAQRPTIEVSRRLLIGGAATLVAVLLIAGLAFSGALARGGMAMTVAGREEVVAQQAAAERHIGRGYDQAVDQVRKARALRLAIPAAQADSIATKALTDLFALRHSAFVSLGQAVGMSTEDGERYARSAEQAAQARSGTTQPSPGAVLLAPRLYAIVARMGELATRLSDEATTALTASPTPTPSPAR